MNGVRLELLKLRRSRIWMLVALIVGIELGWVVAILFVSLASDPEAARFGSGFGLAQASQVHAIFGPILATVVASRLAAIEHDGRMMPLLFAANQRRDLLLRAKFFASWGFCAASSVIVVG
jgi:ABC-type transport system involved in multi-copper enzyme maturation permease subunit